MQYRMFAVPATGAPDLEEELNLFLRSHKVISVQKTVEAIDGAPRWCFCVEYLEGIPGSGIRPSGKSVKVDYKEVLAADEFAVFALLRDTRKQLAAAEAIPVYTVCTNEQLAEMAKLKPSSLTDLKKINGLGEAKVKKYGETFLSALCRSGKEQNEESGKSD
ncbi:MAG: HRDC domain-containing protein [Candidatus Wallbacteria bacterium]|nr:HRDC domain-containing protein [Candidatus Wallbacteria bacterium]